MPPSTPPSIAAATPWASMASCGCWLKPGWRWRASACSAMKRQSLHTKNAKTTPCKVEWAPARAGAALARRRCLCLFELGLGDDPIAPGLLGQIERLVAAVDQVGHRFAALELRHPDRDRDAGQGFAG